MRRVMASTDTPALRDRSRKRWRARHAEARAGLANLLAIVCATAGAGLASLPRAAAVAGPTLTNGPVTLQFTTPVTGLAPDQVINFIISTSSGNLSGSQRAQICAHPANVSNAADFSY